MYVTLYGHLHELRQLKFENFKWMNNVILHLQEVHKQIRMPHRARPMTGLLVFVGLNAALVSTIEPVYDFVCFLPYWERRRERRRKEREAALAKGSGST
nr:uncharacterized protein LOC21386978 [Ipomoea batatas]